MNFDGGTEAIPKFEYWLNGLTGIVTSFDPSSGLYTILLSDYIGTAGSTEPQTVHLRPQNIRSMDSRIPTGFNDEGFGSLQDGASLAAAGYCDSWFCPFCAYAGHCDRTCGYCGSPTPKAPETTTEVLEPAAL